jgi:hypothetical protein
MATFVYLHIYTRKKKDPCSGMRLILSLSGEEQCPASSLGGTSCSFNLMGVGEGAGAGAVVAGGTRLVRS